MLEIWQYKDFQEDIGKFMQRGKLTQLEVGELNSFLEQIQLYDEHDKDRDENLLAVCQEKDGVYSFPFGDGWHLNWMFVRAPHAETSLRMTKIIAVFVLGMTKLRQRKRPW